jgi:hypothetical protein
MLQRGRFQKAGACLLKGHLHPNSKLSESKVRSIKSDQRSAHIIATEYNISPSLVYNIRSGKTWKHIT